MDEHQDDLEPEVQEGAEFETEIYAPESSEGDVTDEPEHEGQGDNTAEQDKHLGNIRQSNSGMSGARPPRHDTARRKGWKR